MTTTKLYATLGHNKLKRRSDIVAARMHNNREMVCENVDQDGPAPEVVFGPTDTWAGVKARLAELEIKPGKNAVLAVELVMGASEDWWVADHDARRIQMKAYERMAWQYLRGRYPPEAIISLTWHLDESNWHLHVVALPIRRRVDGRFADKRERWTLCARGDLSHAAKGPDGKPLVDENGKKVIVPAGDWRGGIGGIQHMEREQTIFAEVMSVLRLERGKEKSRDDDGKSTRQYRIELKAKTAELKRESDAVARERLAVAAESDRQRDDAAELKRLREALNAERAAWDASIAGREAALAAERTRLDDAWKAMDERGRKATKWKRDADARDAAQNARAERLAASSERLNERDESLSELVPVVTRAVAMIDPQTLPPAARAKFYSVARELGVSIERAGKANPRMAGVAASRRTWEGYRVGG